MLHNCTMTMQREATLRIPEWSFGDRVRKARLETGMDQKEFAKALDITASSLAAYETGRANPRFKDAGALAKRLEMLTRIHRGWFLGAEARPSDYNATVSNLPKDREKRVLRPHLTAPRNRHDSTRPKGRTS